MMGGGMMAPGMPSYAAPTPIPPPTNTPNTSSNATTAPKKQPTTTNNQAKVTQTQQSNNTKKPLGPIARPTPPPSNTLPAPVTNGLGDHAPAVNGNKNFMNGNNNNENQAPSEDSCVNGNNTSAETDDNKKINKKNKKKRNPDDKLDDLNSIFAPRSVDCGGVDAADREIEQFKLFCRDSVPGQNRAKVNFDVRNIAFKKKM